MWVGSYTHGLPTYGATTTQRAESVHAALDVCMGSYSTLIACCKGVELYAERKLIRDVAQDVRLEREWGRTTKPDFMVLVKARAGELTVFPHFNVYINVYVNVYINVSLHASTTTYVHCSDWMLLAGRMSDRARLWISSKFFQSLNYESVQTFPGNYRVTSIAAVLSGHQRAAMTLLSS